MIIKNEHPRGLGNGRFPIQLKMRSIPYCRRLYHCLTVGSGIIKLKTKTPKINRIPYLGGSCDGKGTAGQKWLRRLGACTSVGKQPFLTVWCWLFIHNESDFMLNSLPFFSGGFFVLCGGTALLFFQLTFKNQFIFN